MIYNPTSGCTHQAYAAFPRMEPGRILQGHACAALAYQAIRRGTPVHETDLAAAQLALLDEHGQSIVYQPDSFSGTKQHAVDQVLAARGVPPFDPTNPFAEENTVTYLEQTREGAAGLVIRDRASQTSLRFLLVAKGASVTARLDIESDGAATLREEKSLGKPRRRGFHIEMILDADSIECFVDGVACLQAARPAMRRSLEVGVVNEPGISSWFDNFQASNERHLWP